MRLDKVILKAAFSTLGAILVLLIVMFCARSFIFPQTMVEFTYTMGMDGASIHFATRSYDATGDIYYIAYAFETAIGAEDYANVDVCGEKLIADSDEFASYCVSRTEKFPEGVTGTYADYVYRQVCTAKYRCGNSQAALNRALQLCGENKFERNNAMVAVIFAAIAQKDGATVSSALQAMQSINTTQLSSADQQYLADVIAAAQEWTDKNS